MTDLQKIARRILRMIETGETNQDIFARDSGTLAEMVWEKEEESQKAFGHLTDDEVMKLFDLIKAEKLRKEGEV